jgi:hypothetical protein
MELVPSFKYDQIYTEKEIREICPETSMESGAYKDGTKYEYLVASAEAEYWFIRDGEGWKVNHEWTSTILAPKETAAD